MSNPIQHPLRRASIHTFRRKDDHEGGTPFIARFHPYDAYPIFFSGQTESEAIEKATAFANEAIEKHEAAYVTRREAAMKRAKKKEAKA